MPRPPGVIPLLACSPSGYRGPAQSSLGGIGLPDVRDFAPRFACRRPAALNMHMRVMDPGSDRAPANVYGRASLGALTKAEMAERLVDEVGFNRREAGEIVEQFFDEIVGCTCGQRTGQAFGIRQFHTAGQGRAAGPESQDRSRVPHYRPAGGHVSRRSETEGQDGSLRRTAIHSVNSRKSIDPHRCGSMATRTVSSARRAQAAAIVTRQGRDPGGGSGRRRRLERDADRQPPERG